MIQILNLFRMGLKPEELEQEGAMEQVMEKRQDRVLERVRVLARDEGEGEKREGRVGGWAEVRGPIVVHEQTQPTMQVEQSEREN